MKYVCIASTDGTGGVWSVIKESLALLKKEYEVKLIIYIKKNRLESNVKDFLKSENIEYLIININCENGWLFDIGKSLTIKKVKQFIGDEVAIVHSHDAYSSGCYLYFLRSKYYLFCTFHGTLIELGNIKSKIQNCFNKYIRIKLIKCSHAHIISCDSCSVPVLQSYFLEKQKIHVALNGVKSFNLALKRKNKVFTIGYVSRFHPLKGWDIVAQACDLLWKRGVNIKVIFAGTGACAQDVEEWCKNHSEYSVFMGHVQNVHDVILPILDLHVLPTSYPEGLPMIILETMSAGIPSITTDIGGNTIAVENGVNGFIISPKINELAFKIQMLISDSALYKKMQRSNLKKWNEEFSADAMVRQYLSIFNSIVKE